MGHPAKDSFPGGDAAHCETSGPWKGILSPGVTLGDRLSAFPTNVGSSPTGTPGFCRRGGHQAAAPQTQFRDPKAALLFLSQSFLFSRLTLNGVSILAVANTISVRLGTGQGRGCPLVCLAFTGGPSHRERDNRKAK